MACSCKDTISGKIRRVQQHFPGSGICMQAARDMVLLLLLLLVVVETGSQHERVDGDEMAMQSVSGLVT